MAGTWRLGAYARQSPVRQQTHQAALRQISAEDYAVAMLDELEQPRHVRRRFTLGY